MCDCVSQTAAFFETRLIQNDPSAPTKMICIISQKSNFKVQIAARIDWNIVTCCIVEDWIQGEHSLPQETHLWQAIIVTNQNGTYKVPKSKGA